jgi:hypothetical protein
MTLLSRLLAFLGLGREDASRAPLAPPAAQPEPWPAPGFYTRDQLATPPAANDRRPILAQPEDSR